MLEQLGSAESDFGRCGIIRHASEKNETPVSSYRPSLSALINRLYDTLASFDKRTYPGKYRTWLAASPGFSLASVRHWKRGFRNPPATMLRHWASLLRAQAEARLQLADELEAAALERDAVRQARSDAFRRRVLRRHRAKHEA